MSTQDQTQLARVIVSTTADGKTTVEVVLSQHQRQELTSNGSVRLPAGNTVYRASIFDGTVSGRNSPSGEMKFINGG